MIYLDNAATTFPKPVSVSAEVSRCIEEYCGNPGRGSHYMSRAASEKLFEVRSKLCDMYNAPSPENVVFTLNTTYAINTALKSLVKSGDHILISDLEHNSVLRSVNAVCNSRGASFDIFRTYSGDSDRIIKDINMKLKKRTAVIICLHASNICGTVLPIERIGMLCRKNSIFFIADAAQSAGLYDIDIKNSGISVLCLPAHKGLYGPQGIAASIFNDVAPESLSTFVEGGSGVNSSEITMPDILPDRFEAGTMPTPAAAGFSAGIDFILKNTPRAVRFHESELAGMLYSNLISDKRLTVYSKPGSSGIVLFNVNGLTSVETAKRLDKVGICVRAGFHCAPLAHKTLNTGESGAVRVSFGAFNDKRDVKILTDSLLSIIKEV